jgi:hypothetical protein
MYQQIPGQYNRNSGDQFGAAFAMDGMDMSNDGQYMGYGHPQHVSTM